MKRYSVIQLLFQRWKAQSISPPARKETEGLSLSPGDPFISAVAHAAAELKLAVDGAGGGEEEVGGKI